MVNISLSSLNTLHSIRIPATVSTGRCRARAEGSRPFLDFYGLSFAPKWERAAHCDVILKGTSAIERFTDDSGPLAAERRFFTGLLAGNVEALDRVLGDDFMLIDVMGGSEIPKAALLEVIRAGQLKFEAIERFDSRVRFFQSTAVVRGTLG